MKIILKISMALLFGLFGCTGDKDKSASATGVDREITKIRLTDLNGQPVDLEGYSGKTIFINFWATWCKPCIEEMPSIAKAQNILRNEKVVFLLAGNEDIEQIEEFSIKHNFKFNYVRIENNEALNIQALPTTVIFSPDGNIVFSEMGYRKWDDSTNINMILKIAKENE